MNIKCSFMLHDWKNWETEKNEDGSVAIMKTYRKNKDDYPILQEIIQKRRCVECNKLDIKRVRF